MARTVLMLVVATAAGICGCKDQPQELAIFAAASTSDAMTELARSFEAATGTKVVCTFGGSAALARQIESGARADLYLSASPEWMDELERKGLIERGSRRDLLGNALVWVERAGAPTTSPAGAAHAFAPGAAMPRIGEGRFALGDPAHVPAGKYARQALERLGWWTALKPHVITTPDVRAALRLVEIGEADAAVIYATDAAGSAKVRVVGTFASELHESIRYPLARCRGARPKAAELERYLCGPDGDTVFRRLGFIVGSLSTRPERQAKQ